MALSGYLRECAERAALVLGDDVDTSITLREHGVTLRAGSSTVSAKRCDQAEAMSGEGPCIVAMEKQEIQVVASVLRESRWDDWREQTLAEGFVKAVAVPAAVTPTIAVALNAYSRVSGAWPAKVISAAQAHVRLIAEAVRLRLLFADVDDAAAGLYRTLSDAAAVERALGAIRETNDCGETEARRILVNAAQEGGLSEREVAEPILRALVVGGRGDIVDEPGL